MRTIVCLDAPMHVGVREEAFDAYRTRVDRIIASGDWGAFGTLDSDGSAFLAASGL